jgi:hypothetical protein
MELIVSDARGTYTAPDMERMRPKIEGRGDAPNELRVYVDTFRIGMSKRTKLDIWMKPEGNSSFILDSFDEAIVDHVQTRLRALFEQAVRRAEPAPDLDAVSSHLPGALVVRPRSQTPHRRHRWLHEPNPWVLVIVRTALATVIAGIILAIVLS